jgi:hypothetical protein
MPWRIVIGRLGRLGHGELKSKKLILIGGKFHPSSFLFSFRLGNNFIEKESCSLRHINS